MLLKIYRFSLNIFFTLFFALNTQAQQTYKMVDAGNKWYEFGGYSIPGFEEVHTMYRIYSYSGDTLINGTSYKQLHAQVLDSLHDVTPSVSSYTYYAGAFRQDSLKVFFVQPTNTSENLYCDFDLNIADTLNYFYNTYPNVKIDSIFNIPFGTTTRKKYKLSNGMYFYDGIGNFLGLFKDFYFAPEGNAYTICYEQHGIVENIVDWGLNPGISCPFVIDAFVGLKENSSSNEITIFPIPFSDFCTIKFNTIKEKNSVMIYNALGVLIKTIDSMRDGSVIIEKGNLTSGLYFVKLTNRNNDIIIKKIIIE